MHETSYHRFQASPVPGILPVDGVELVFIQSGWSETYRDLIYIARSAQQDTIIQISQRWDPDQDQFAWLVRNGALRTGFINSIGVRCPWSNDTIAAAMDLEPQALVAC